MDAGALDAIAAAPGLGPGQGVLEIGPGTWDGRGGRARGLAGVAGAFAAAHHTRYTPVPTFPPIPSGTGNLTRRLLASGAAVTAVEKDDALFAALAADLGQARGCGAGVGVGGGRGGEVGPGRAAGGASVGTSAGRAQAPRAHPTHPTPRTPAWPWCTATS